MIREVDLDLRARDRAAALEALAAMHLQWFAAEDEGRTEDPTEQKVRKAREDGKVAKSADVSSAIVLLFTVVALGLLGDYMLGNLIDMTRFYLQRAGDVDAVESGVLMSAFFGYFIRISLPLAMVAFVAAIFGNVVQFGFLFTTKPITPDLNRIAPKFGKWVERSFLSTEALFNFTRNTGKVVVIGVISYIIIRSRFDRMAKGLLSRGVRICGTVGVCAPHRFGHNPPRSQPLRLHLSAPAAPGAAQDDGSVCRR